MAASLSLKWSQWLKGMVQQATLQVTDGGAGKREGVLGVAIWCEAAKWRLQLHLFSPGVCRGGSKAGVKWTLLTPPWLRITNKIRDLQRRPPALWGSPAKAASYLCSLGGRPSFPSENTPLFFFLPFWIHFIQNGLPEHLVKGHACKRG